MTVHLPCEVCGLDLKVGDKIMAKHYGDNEHGEQQVKVVHLDCPTPVGKN